MYSKKLREELTGLAHNYGNNHIGPNYFHPTIRSKDAVIFNDIKFNFNYKSWVEINDPKNKHYFARTQKKHTHFSITPAIYEMQSSNSSDALAMNIFCYPDINKWQGLKNLFNVNSLSKIEFGYKAAVSKIVDGKREVDNTEIDILIDNKIICECKLTEESFTEKDKTTVEEYEDFKDVFHFDKLLQNDKSYMNYQLIRNILAAKKCNCRFILICDMRRPDLAKSFFKTVSCIKDDYLHLRTNCEIIYWQDIAQVVGKELKDFLNEKYGI